MERRLFSKCNMETTCFVYSIANAIMALSSFIIIDLYDDSSIGFSKIFTVFWFLMSGLLCYGVYKADPNILLAYFIFNLVSAIVVVPLVAILSMFYILLSEVSIIGPLHVVVYIFCAINEMSPVLVYLTYDKMKGYSRKNDFINQQLILKM